MKPPRKHCRRCGKLFAPRRANAVNCDRCREASRVASVAHQRKVAEQTRNATHDPAEAIAMLRAGFVPDYLHFDWQMPGADEARRKWDEEHAK